MTYSSTSYSSTYSETSFMEPENRFILGMRVDATDYIAAANQIVAWAQKKEGSYVCAANVHMTMETWDNPSFAQVVNGAALVTPDGMPLVWALKGLGISDATRVCGPSLTLQVCQTAANAGIPIGLYGGTPEKLETFSTFLTGLFPNLEVACKIAPPFRPPTPEEDAQYTEEIIASGARILFVGIGCPKQEKWMAAHKDQLPVVMLGVGAAFDFHSGRVKQAPKYLQELGLEWAFRLAMEPRRLWKRYIFNNPRFIVLFLWQWVASLLGISLFRADTRSNQQ